MSSNNSWNSQYNSAIGDLLVGNGTRPVVVPVGADGTALVADSGQPEGVTWGFPSGVITNPGQPLFRVYQSVSSGGVTGAGTFFYFGNNGGGTAVVEVDQNSNTSFVGGDLVFTAPVTGNYFFVMNWILDGVTALMTALNIQQEKNGVDFYNGMSTNAANARNPVAASLVVNSSNIIPLVAADTIKFRIVIQFGAGDTATVRGALATPGSQSYMAGYLIG